MPRFVVCVPAEGAPASTPPCGDVDGVPHTTAVVELPAPGSIEFSNSDELFAFGFGAVITFWALGLGVGAVLSVIRRGG